MFFGFDRTPLVDWWMTREMLFTSTRWIYHTLVFQPQILIATLFALGMADRGWRFLAAWCLTLLVDVALFPLFPALGSPPYFLDFMDVFNGSRDGSLRLLDAQALTGIITFPSFHAGAAVLLGWGFGRIPKIGPAMVALNVLMFLSALIAGHYLIDLIAGGLIAVAMIALSSAGLHQIEERAATRALTPARGFASLLPWPGPADGSRDRRNRTCRGEYRVNAAPPNLSAKRRPR